MQLGFAKIEATASASTIVVAGVSGRRIRVIHYVCVADAALSFRFQSGGGSPTDLTGAMTVDANGGVATSAQDLGTGGQGVFGLFETLAGEDLLLQVDAGGNVNGHLTYYLV